MDEEVSDCERAAKSTTVLSMVTIGSTAVVAVVGEEEVVVVTCGDSRVVMEEVLQYLCLMIISFKKNERTLIYVVEHVVRMLTNPNPDRRDELERIKGAGGRL
ncbi:probable protein phosphatase 2C 24 [Camellia sinensis]|uniref:probable protein phosphatase 2C 24 n=1 Tax=Camellia sinensis TaxID=4442 RepID=UPI001036DF67|nr:probable protein phosphatase 2C 24 [Camellia sinensis]